VLLVFLVHHHNLFGRYLPESSVLLTLSQFGNVIGHSGVDLFFVLSGYLIYGHLIQRPVSYVSFFRKRIRRIYPTFLVVLGTYVLLCHLIPSISKLPRGASKELLYVVGNILLLPGIFDIPALVTVAWSLSYEFFFYLCIPSIIALFGMRTWRRGWRISFFASLTLIHFVGYRFALLPHIRLAMFLAGVIAYEIADGGWLKGKLSRGGEFFMVTGYLAVLGALGNSALVPQSVVPEYPSILRISLLWAALFGLTIYSTMFNGMLTAIFSYAPLRYLGNMSYSYFLLHGLILNVVAFSLVNLVGVQGKSEALFLALLPVNLLLTLAASLALFLLVEKPFSLAVTRRRIATGGPTKADVRGIGEDKEQVCSE